MNWLRNLLRSLVLEPVTPAPRPISPPRPRTAARPAPPVRTAPPRKTPDWKSPHAAWAIPRQPDYQELSRLVADLFARRVAPGRTVPWSLPLAKLRIRELPDNMTVAGDLDLRQCQRLRRIGDGLTVAGNLDIGGRCGETMWWEADALTCRWGLVDNAAFAHHYSRESQPPLSRLPERLRVHGDLCLRTCPEITMLPSDCSVTGGLTIEGCPRFAALPDPFHAPGNLSLKGCRLLTALPESLHVGGDLALIGLPINRLPTHLSIGGSLLLESCPRMESLPDGLNVAGSLTVRNCPLQELPPRLQVGGKLLIRRCPHLNTLPGDLSVAGDIHVDRCAEFESVPEDLVIRQGLRISNCRKLTSLPDGLTVPVVLSLRGCTALDRFPRRARIGLRAPAFRRKPVLILIDCRELQSLPGDLRLGGAIDLAGSGVTDLPPQLASARVMWRGIAVRPVVVFHPEQLMVHEILAERNAELRRLMLERVGCDRLLEMGQARVIDKDRDPGGPRQLVEFTLRFEREPHRYLHCRCPSTSREYLLRVPPAVETCHAAAAWLAGFDDPGDYAPRLET